MTAHEVSRRFFTDLLEIDDPDDFLSLIEETTR